MPRMLIHCLGAALFLGCTMAAAADFDPVLQGDRPLGEPLVHPDWFRLSFLDLREDLREATAAGKGLILYYGQDDCPYCKAHLVNNWERPDIVAYTRRHFEVVAIDVRGARLVTDFDGHELPEKAFAARHRINFTPTLEFYRGDGRPVLRLAGYRPPYSFRAALEYVADGHDRRESLRDYLARAVTASSYGRDELNASELFAPPPYDLTRSTARPGRPLVVFFEQRRCHPCDVLHAGPLEDEAIRARLRRFDVIQLDMWADTPLVTPDGRRRTARRWADELGVDYAPTLVFFDGRGQEVLRLASVVGFWRLQGVLDYVLDEGYRRYPGFIQWREAQHRRR